MEYTMIPNQYSYFVMKARKHLRSGQVWKHRPGRPTALEVHMP